MSLLFDGEPFEDSPQSLAATSNIFINTNWHIYTLADAYKPRPALEYIVAGLMVRPSLNIIYGAPGIFKSLLLNDMCVCVAAGLDWLPSATDKHDTTSRPTVQSAVMWLDFDSGSRRTHERFEALARARNLSESIPLFYVSMPDPWLDVSSKKDVENLAQLFRAMEIKLAVIDNLGVTKGGAEENSSDMAVVMSKLRWLTERSGAVVNVIHHQRKGSVGTSGTRIGEGLRGHSSIEAAVDLALLIEQKDVNDKSRIVIQSTKSRDFEVIPFGAKFNYQHKQGTMELVWAKFNGFALHTDAASLAIRAAILTHLASSGPVSQTTVVNQVRLKVSDAAVNRVRTALDELEAEGSVIASKGKQGTKLYQVPSQSATRLDLIRKLLLDPSAGDVL